ncbi:hypothetical protein RYX36_017795 [Vicia faba]
MQLAPLSLLHETSSHYPFIVTEVKTTTLSLSSLTSSLSSLSFSSHISCKPTTISLPRTFSLYRSSKLPSPTVSATSLAPPAKSEIADLKTYVKSRLPGGFAAQTIFGTGRQKNVVTRVLLQEGTRKFVINYRDADVSSLHLFFVHIILL